MHCFMSNNLGNIIIIKRMSYLKCIKNPLIKIKPSLYHIQISITPDMYWKDIKQKKRLKCRVTRSSGTRNIAAPTQETHQGCVIPPPLGSALCQWGGRAAANLLPIWPFALGQDHPVPRQPRECQHKMAQDRSPWAHYWKLTHFCLVTECSLVYWSVMLLDKLQT